MLDEIPMVIVNSACIYMLIEWRSKRHYPYLPHVITALTSLVLLMYMFCDQYGFFITTFVLQSAFITISSFKVANQLRKGDQSKRLCSALFTASYLMYFSGIILWLMDIILCPYVQSFHLHSFWHLLSGAATFIWLQFQIGVRGVNTGHRIAISHLILPIVAYQDNIKGK
uniref:Alkaline ceramidase n=1 Tax=Spongospora subterranea TaxID=70186 RepID=A0A0H5RA91_9EUKA|eukprot:CRZ11070.1 hypothetical protein [Spongospora subterranea]